ncbi:MAG: protein kinase [Candidatus Melainabacteria bacterium]|nr:protein kinase [Candidatus Melainabacteria bacterium]
MSDPLDKLNDAVDPLELEQRYTEWQPLGEGGMGKVFVAHDQMLDKKVAIKLLHSDVDTKAIVRFQQEAKVLSRLGHKFIVKIMDFHYSKSGQLFLVMEYIDGKSIETEIEEHERLPPEEVLRIAIQLSQALQHAHSQGIIHRDLKPANVMLDRQRNAKILDFGIAKLASTTELFGTLTSAGQLIGSPLYMSPEQIEGQPASELSDVYGLGLLIFTMIVGYPPFAGENLLDSLKQRLKTEPPSLRQYVANEQLRDGLDAIVKHALNPNQNLRFENMADFEQQLTTLSDSVFKPKIDDTGVIHIDGPGYKKPILVSLALLLIFGATGFWLINTGVVKVRTADDTAAIEKAHEEKIDETVKANIKRNPYRDIFPQSLKMVGLDDTVPSDNKNRSVFPLVDGFVRDGQFQRAPSPVSQKNMDDLRKSGWKFASFDKNKSLSKTILEQLPPMNLRGLSFSGTNISDSDLKEVSKNKSLIALRLKKTAISNHGIKYLHPLREKLVRLELDDCKQITDGVIPELENSLPKLRNFQASRTGLTRDGVNQLRKFPELEKVGFGGLNITDDDIISFKYLNHINLEGCPNITDVTVRHFARQRGVRVFNVQKCPLVTAKGISYFRISKPKMRNFFFSSASKVNNLDDDISVLYDEHDEDGL